MINGRSVQVFELIFFASMIYILVKIGLRRFKYYDFYKLIFPVYLVIYLAKHKSIFDFFMAGINLLMLALIITFFVM